MGIPRVQIMSRELVCSTQNRQQRSTWFATILPRPKRSVDGAMVISRSCALVPHARPNGRWWVSLVASRSKFFSWAEFAFLHLNHRYKPNHRTLYMLKLFSHYENWGKCILDIVLPPWLFLTWEIKYCKSYMDCGAVNLGYRTWKALES